MSVDAMDGMGNTKQEDVMTNKAGLKTRGLDKDSELVLSKVSGDYLHYIYFRIEVME